ncbi:hypothetical protein CRUP_033883 [Coryphaenoides rupestris]|nr:hypothetical protein CRUP_033883 [Coryphaenoides rupestris]
MAQCSSDATGKLPPSAGSPPGLGTTAASASASPQRAVDQSMKPVLFEIFGELWHVEARLGEGVSASVYQVSSGRATATSTAAAAVKEFQAGGQGGDYGYQKERSVLEDIQGGKNIVTLYGVFTNHSCAGVPTHCLLLELLDVSVSELLVRSSSSSSSSSQAVISSTQGGSGRQGHSMWMVQHCARDVLEALAYLHGEGYYIQTDGYRAPEAELQNSLALAGVEAEGDSGCSTAVDMWSLGIVLLEMYSGMKLKQTIHSAEWEENNAAIVDHIFASKTMVWPAIPIYHLRDLIKSMLCKDPKDRITAEAALLNPFFSIPFAPHVEDLVLLPSPVFVEYTNSNESKEAQKMLTGRTFDGRFVVATFYPRSSYKRGYLYQCSH